MKAAEGQWKRDGERARHRKLSIPTVAPVAELCDWRPERVQVVCVFGFFNFEKAEASVRVIGALSTNPPSPCPHPPRSDCQRPALQCTKSGRRTAAVMSAESTNNARTVASFVIAKL